MILRTLSPFAILGATPWVLSASNSEGGVFGAFCLLWFCCIIVLAVIPAIGMYKVFEKAGQPGWHALIPLLNGAVLAHIVGRDWWWGIIPYLNLVPVFETGKTFGKSSGYGVGLILLPVVFWPMLGFSDAQYQLERREPLF